MSDVPRHHHNLAPDASVVVSPNTARAMARMRRAVYGVLGLLVVGGIVASMALYTQAVDIERLVQGNDERGQQIEVLVEHVEDLLEHDQAERGNRAERLAGALAEVAKDHDRMDEADARRQEILRDQILQHLHALEGDSTPHPNPGRLPRRGE